MLQNFISSELKEVLEHDFNILILYYEQWKDRNGYTEEEARDCAFYCDDEIMLGKYNDPKIEILCLFHEIGHIISSKTTTGIYCCTMYQESVAWEYGKNAIVKYQDLISCTLDFDDYYSIENEFIRKCLKSYLDGEYNDLIALEDRFKK
jgi:hypothetical protein